MFGIPLFSSWVVTRIHCAEVEKVNVCVAMATNIAYSMRQLVMQQVDTYREWQAVDVFAFGMGSFANTNQSCDPGIVSPISAARDQD